MEHRRRRFSHRCVVTTGRFVVSGKTFRHTDAWTNRTNAHRALEDNWVGTIEFYLEPERKRQMAKTEGEEIEVEIAEVRAASAEELEHGHVHGPGGHHH